MINTMFAVLIVIMLLIMAYVMGMVHRVQDDLERETKQKRLMQGTLYELQERVRELERLIAEGEEPLAHLCDDDCVHAGLECVHRIQGACRSYRRDDEA